MADCSKALSDALDATRSKDARLATFLSLMQRLETQERSEDVLDAVNSKWWRLSDLFLHEVDDELLARVSEFLSMVGKIAVLYGRFSASRVNQYIYLTWASSELRRLNPGGKQLELLLIGVSSCLADLEGSAFKSVAPKLLTCCHELLNKAKTPIRVFGKILDLLCCLCKVPAAIRDQFKRIVDLILGWASYPECPEETRPQIRKLFLKLQVHWEENLDYGWNLILSVTKDLCNMLDERLQDSGASSFANLIGCLVSIFESCSPFLTTSMLSQTFAQVNLLIQAVALYPALHGEKLSVLEFADQMADQLRILLTVLLNRKIPNGIQNVFGFLNRTSGEAIVQSEALTGVLHLHFAFLEELQFHLEEIVNPVLEAYGSTSFLFDLRSNYKASLVRHLFELYKRLICHSTSTIQLYFIQLFLQDITTNLQSVLNRSEETQQGGNSAVLVLDSNLPVKRMKEQMFGLKLLTDSVQTEEITEDCKTIIWQRIFEFMKEKSKQHPRILLQSIKLLRSVHTPSPTLLSSLLDLINKQNLFNNENTASLVLDWILEGMKDKEQETKAFPKKLESLLLTKMISHQSFLIRKQVLIILQEAQKQKFEFHDEQEFLLQVYSCISDLHPAVSSTALDLIKHIKFVSLFKFCIPQSLPDFHSSLTMTLTSTQVDTLLKNLAQGWPLDRQEMNCGVEWIGGMMKELDQSMKVENLKSVMQCGRFLIQQISKQIVLHQFSHFDSGPAFLLSHFKSQLTKLQQHLDEKKSIDHFHVWLLLELVFLVEKEVNLAFEGDSIPPTVQAFYITNKRTFDEWFGSLLFKILVVSHRCGLDFHAGYFGSTLIKQLAVELGSKSLLQLCTVPIKQTLVKIRQKASPDVVNKQMTVLRQVFKGVVYTCLSLKALGDHEGILGIRSDLLPVLDGLLEPLEGIHGTILLSWMNPLSLEAQEKINQAVEGYNQSFEELYQMEENFLQELNSAEIKETLQKILQILKVSILERLTQCYSRLGDWETFIDFKEKIQNSEFKSKMKSRLYSVELEMLFDLEDYKNFTENFKNWKEPAGLEFRTMEDLRESVNLFLQRQRSSETGEAPWKLLSRLQHLIPLQETAFSSRILQLTHCLQSMEDPSQLETLSGFLDHPEEALAILFPRLRQEEGPTLELQSHLLMSLLRLKGKGGTLGFLSLLLMKMQIDKGNYDQAARILEKMNSMMEEFPDWLKSAVSCEKSRLVLLNGKSEKESWILWYHEFQSAIQAEQNLQNLKYKDAAGKVLSNQFTNLMESVEWIKDSTVLQEVEVPELVGSVKTKYWFQLEQAGIFSTSPEKALLAKAQGYCLISALELNPNLSVCWKKLSQLLLTRSAQDSLGWKPAMEALCEALKMNTALQVDHEVLLELYSLIKKKGEVLLDDEMVLRLHEVPVKLWKNLSTQLISLLGHHQSIVRNSVVWILKKLVEVSPSDVLFPVLVEWRKQKWNLELQSMIQYFNQQKEEVVGDMMILLDELEKLNSLVSEDWLIFLNEVHMESQVRLSVLQDEIKRIKNEELSERRAQLWKEAYGVTMMPLVVSIRNKVSGKQNYCMTAFEKEYWMGLEPRVTETLSQLELQDSLGDFHGVEKKWTALKSLLREVGEEAKKPLPALSKISPRLLQLRNTMIPVPGARSSSVTLSCFQSKIEILATKTRPKILKILGSDGESYTFLLKGKEDMNIDHRLLQFLNITNGILEDKQKIRSYSVTPLGERLGLIQWVENTVSFYSLFTNWQERQRRKLQIQNDSTSSAGGGSTDQKKTIPLDIDLHPKLLFKKKLSQAFSQSELSKTLPRRSWPVEILLKVFNKLKSESPKHLLKNEIYRISSSPSAFWKKTRNFVKSTSMSSVLCSVLGIGDRHLDNLLLDTSTAELINIDFNLCFGNGEKLRVPEIVPFRMTQIMEEALGIGKIQGCFKSVFKKTLEDLRKHSPCLKVFLEAVLMDPMMDWTTNKTKWNSKIGLDQILKLKLMLKRLNLKKGINRIFQEHLNCMKELTIWTEASISSAIRLRELTGFLDRASSSFQEMQEELGVLQEQETGLVSLLQEQEERYKGDLKLEEERKETVLQILQYNEKWCYRHTCLLQTIFNQTEELCLLPEEKWNSAFAPFSNSILLPSSTGPPLLTSLFPDQSIEQILPQEMLQECFLADQQRSLLDSTREEFLTELLTALNQYSFLVKILLSEDSLWSSFHFKYLRNFQTALDLLSFSSKLGHRWLKRDQTKKNYEALSGSYEQIQLAINRAKTAAPSDELSSVQKTAAAKIIPLQKAMSSTWNFQLFRHLLIELCQQQIQSLTTGYDSLEQWTQKVSGLSQIFRFFRNPRLSQQVLSAFWDVDANHTDSVSTGFQWLDAVEQYTSKLALLLQNIKNGPLIDLLSFLQTQFLSEAQALDDIYKQYFNKSEELCKAAWEDAELELTLQQQLQEVESHKNRIKLSLEKIDQEMIDKMDLPSGVEAQSLAEEQQELARQVQEAQGQEEGLEKDLGRLKQKSEEIMIQFEMVCKSFVWSLSGSTKQAVKFETEAESIEMQLASCEWGDLNFPVFQPLFIVFQNLEVIEVDIMTEQWTKEKLTKEQKSQFKTPTKFRKFDTWMEDMSLTASLSHSLHLIMKTACESSTLHQIFEDHFLDLLQRKASPVLLNGLHHLQSSLLMMEEDPAEQDLTPRLWNEALDSLISFIKTQGEYAYCALMHQSSVSWAENENPDQTVRLHHLAAMEWTQAPHLESSSHGYLQAYLSKQDFLTEINVSSRHELLVIMKEKMEALMEVEEIGKVIESSGEKVLMMVEQYLRGALEGCPDEDHCRNLMNSAQLLINERQNWRQEATQLVSGMTHIIQTLLQFEFSRDGLTWSPGSPPDQQAFEQFQVWLNDTCQSRDSLKKTEETLLKNRTQVDSTVLLIEGKKTEEEACAAEIKTVKEELTEKQDIVLNSVQKLTALSNQLVKEIPKLILCFQEFLSPWMEQFGVLTDSNKQLSELTLHHKKCLPFFDSTIDGQKNLIASIQSFLQVVLSHRKPQTERLDCFQRPEQQLLCVFMSESSIQGVQDLNRIAAKACEELKSLKESMDSLVMTSWSLVKKNDPTIELNSNTLDSSESQDCDLVWVSNEGLSQGLSDERMIIQLDGLDFPMVLPFSKEILPSSSSSTISDHKEEIQDPSFSQPCISRPLKKTQLAYSDSTISSFENRLFGRQIDGQSDSSVEVQTDYLISEATKDENLCKMYEGWMSWI